VPEPTGGLVTEKANLPLADASITQVDLLNQSTVIVEFSNGDTVTIEAEKLKELVMAGGLRHLTASDLDAENEFDPGSDPG
jgi:hypothetical protein